MATPAHLTNSSPDPRVVSTSESATLGFGIASSQCFIPDNRVSSVGVVTPVGLSDWVVLVDCRALCGVIGAVESDSGTIRADYAGNTLKAAKVGYHNYIAKGKCRWAYLEGYSSFSFSLFDSL